MEEVALMAKLVSLNSVLHALLPSDAWLAQQIAVFLSSGEAVMLYLGLYVYMLFYRPT